MNDSLSTLRQPCTVIRLWTTGDVDARDLIRACTGVCADPPQDEEASTIAREVWGGDAADIQWRTVDGGNGFVLEDWIDGALFVSLLLESRPITPACLAAIGVRADAWLRGHGAALRHVEVVEVKVRIQRSRTSKGTWAP